MGDCCHVVVVVISHKPGLRVCVQANTAIARKLQPNVIFTVVARIAPFASSRSGSPAFSTLYVNTLVAQRRNWCYFFYQNTRE
jgi:hypothetical protein